MQPIQFTRPDQREVELQPWSDTDLFRMAEVTDLDQRRAMNYWRRFLPRRFRTLLDAVSSVTRGLPLV